MRYLDDVTNSMDEFEQIPGDREAQRNLVCCSSWGHRVRHDLVADQQQWCEIIELSLKLKLPCYQSHIMSTLPYSLGKQK